MGQTVRLRGIRAEGSHGARPGERESAQPFEVDLDIQVEASGDDLDSTADYREVVEAVRSIVAEESVSLIETLAELIAARVAGMPGVRGCVTTVHKPRAAERLEVADISARAEAP